MKLTPAMEIKSCITYIKEIGAGTAVSLWRYSFVADHTMKVATIPVGYGDGYVRSLPEREMLIRGKRAAILGLTCRTAVYECKRISRMYRRMTRLPFLGKDGSEAALLWKNWLKSPAASIMKWSVILETYTKSLFKRRKYSGY